MSLHPLRSPGWPIRTRAYLLPKSWPRCGDASSSVSIDWTPYNPARPHSLYLHRVLLRSPAHRAAIVMAPAMRVLPLVTRLRVRPLHQARVLAPGWDWRRRRVAPAAEPRRAGSWQAIGHFLRYFEMRGHPSSNWTLVDSAIRRRCTPTKCGHDRHF